MLISSSLTMEQLRPFPFLKWPAWFLLLPSLLWQRMAPTLFSRPPFISTLGSHSNMRANTTRSTLISSIGSIGFLTNLMSTSIRKTGVLLCQISHTLGSIYLLRASSSLAMSPLFLLVPIFLHAHYFWSRSLICQCCQPPLGLPTFPYQGIGRHSSQYRYLAWKFLWRKSWHPEPW